MISTYDFIDIHSHNLKAEPQIFKLNSLRLKDLKEGLRPKDLKNPFTIGVHPWDLEEGIYQDQNFEEIFAGFFEHKLCWGIGEIGLDRSLDVDFTKQEELFNQVLKWAMQKMKHNFLILHSVRSQNEILKNLKSQNYQGQALFHDYNGSYQDWLKLKSHSYIISLGGKILNPKTKASRLVETWAKDGSWPWGDFYLESDDTNQSVIELYQHISRRTGLSLEEIQVKFKEGFSKVFAARRA